MLPAAGANQLLGTPLPPHPQLQRLLFLINLMLINLIARPAQNLRPVVASSHATKCTESLPPSEPNKTRVRYRFLRRARLSVVKESTGFQPVVASNSDLDISTLRH